MSTQILNYRQGNETSSPPSSLTYGQIAVMKDGTLYTGNESNKPVSYMTKDEINDTYVRKDAQNDMAENSWLIWDKGNNAGLRWNIDNNSFYIRPIYGNLEFVAGDNGSNSTPITIQPNGTTIFNKEAQFSNNLVKNNGYFIFNNVVDSGLQWKLDDTDKTRFIFRYYKTGNTLDLLTLQDKGSGDINKTVMSIRPDGSSYFYGEAQNVKYSYSGKFSTTVSPNGDQFVIYCDMKCQKIANVWLVDIEGAVIENNFSASNESFEYGISLDKIRKVFGIPTSSKVQQEFFHGQFYQSDMTIPKNRIQYAAGFQLNTNNNSIKPARVYNTSGTVGSWGSSTEVAKPGAYWKIDCITFVDS